MVHKNISFFFRKISLIGYITLVLGTMPGTILGNQIGILPSIVTGELPKRNSQTRIWNYSKEFSLLSKDIIENNFLVGANTLDSDLNSQDISQACMQNRVHFVLKDHFSFSQGLTPFIHSTLLNCKTRMKTEKESPLNGYAIHSIQNHYKGLFRFLPKKDENRGKPISFSWAVYVFLDSNGAISYEKSNLENWIFQSRPGDNSYLLTYMSNNQEYQVKGNLQNRIDLPMRGANSNDSVVAGLNRFIARNQPGVERNLQVLLLSPGQSGNSIPLINTINRGRQMERSTILVVPVMATVSELQAFERIANSTQSSIIYPLIQQRLGLESGKIGILTMHKGYLRWSVDSGEKRFPMEGRISPLAMADTFAILNGEKVIQKGELDSNLVMELDRQIDKFRNPAIQQGKRILVQAHGIASWININPGTRYSIGDSYIMETTFYPDPNTSSGVSNHSGSTQLHSPRYTYPLLMEYGLDEIPNILKKYKLSELKSYIPVTVIEER